MDYRGQSVKDNDGICGYYNDQLCTVFSLHLWEEQGVIWSRVTHLEHAGQSCLVDRQPCLES